MPGATSPRRSRRSRPPRTRQSLGWRQRYATLDATAELLLTEWPIGTRTRHSEHESARSWPATGRALRAHFSLGDPLARHAVRLVVTFCAATALAHLLDLPHEYWLPMTVAWISKPTMGDTKVRVMARAAGTVAGVVVSAVVVEGVEPGPWALVVLIGGSAAVSIGFLAANYAVAVAGITTFVFFLFALAGEDVDSSLPARLAATVGARILVLLGAFLRPTRSGAQVNAERAAAQAAVLESLHLATSQCVACELAGAGADDRAASDAVVVELVDLHGRLAAVEAGDGMRRGARLRGNER